MSRWSQGDNMDELIHYLYDFIHIDQLDTMTSTCIVFSFSYN